MANACNFDGGQFEYILNCIKFVWFLPETCASHKLVRCMGCQCQQIGLDCVWDASVNNI